MATDENKERKDRSAEPTLAGNKKDMGGKPSTEKKDPDLYDPMGMAGQKAGIVQQVEQVISKDPEGTEPNSGKENEAPSKG